METVQGFESRNYPKQLHGNGLIATMSPGLKLGPQVPVSSTRPLGDRSDTTFEVLVAVTTWPEPPTRRLLMQSSRTEAQQTKKSVDELLQQGAVELDVSSLVVAEDVPAVFPRLVRRISEVIGPRDDAAPGGDRGTGSDQHRRRGRGTTALRSGPPLAEPHGARRVRSAALFGPRKSRRSLGRQETRHQHERTVRSRGLAVDWDTDHGRAVALDATRPFAPELRALLLRMHELYPFRSPPSRRYETPTPPPPSSLPLDRDKYAFFGQAIQSSILFTIAEFGWTFQAVCVQVAKTHRETVKSALTSMEVDDGLLQSSRPLGPGFGARSVTIADRFGARELETILAGSDASGRT